MEVTSEEIIPTTGKEIIEASSVMYGTDEDIIPTTSEKITEVFSVMNGTDEKIILTDGVSDERTSEMNWTDLEKLSMGAGELEKMLAGGEIVETRLEISVLD
jgi:hypothetical protein